MLESAYYSYLTRCSDAQGALRCLALAVELLKTRGGTAAEDAARWATKILDLGLAGPTGRVLFSERIAACYASKLGAGGSGWGSRKRKAAFWYLLAVDSWLQLRQPALAQTCLNLADELYGTILPAGGQYPFPEMQDFVDGLRHSLKSQKFASGDKAAFGREADAETLVPEETSAETFDHRKNRRSIIGGPNALDLAPLSPALAKDGTFSRDDDFE